jgi:L-asparaginase II
MRSLKHLRRDHRGVDFANHSLDIPSVINLYDRLDRLGSSTLTEETPAASSNGARTWPAHVPVAVQSRGPVVENVYYGTVVATASDGAVLFAAGDPSAAFYARSALKPLQALAMLRCGLQVDGELLAVAVASHSGEPHHLQAVLALLSLYDLTPDNLQNVTALPYDPAEQTVWLRTGRNGDRVAQNCSGKHAAMLATCRVNGWPIADYLDATHPLQRAIAATIESTTGRPILGVSVDGCGAPVFATTLDVIASAYGRLCGAADGSDEQRIATAMREHPATVAGQRRDVTAAMTALPGVVFKDGAEGIQAVGLPDGRGVAVKIASGDHSVRMPVAVRALRYLDATADELDALAVIPALGGGNRVGELEALDFLSEGRGRR